MNAQCEKCRFWRRGYRLQQFKVAAFCNHHKREQPGNAMCCAQFENIDTRSIEHPPYHHPGDVA